MPSTLKELGFNTVVSPSRIVSDPGLYPNYYQVLTGTPKTLYGFEFAVARLDYSDKDKFNPFNELVGLIAEIERISVIFDQNFSNPQLAFVPRPISNKVVQEAQSYITHFFRNFYKQLNEPNFEINYKLLLKLKEKIELLLSTPDQVAQLIESNTYRVNRLDPCETLYRILTPEIKQLFQGLLDWMDSEYFNQIVESTKAEVVDRIDRLRDTGTYYDGVSFEGFAPHEDIENESRQIDKNIAAIRHGLARIVKGEF